VAVAVAEAVLLAGSNHVDEVVGELVRADVPALQPGVQRLGVVPIACSRWVLPSPEPS